MTFFAPLFLLAALAGAIPVVLHMINRQRARDLPFSTLRFLRVSAQKTRRRKQVHDLFLMLVRVAVLLLIAAGLAKPTVTNLRSLFGTANSAVAIVLDNSASMGLVDNDRLRFETALAAAQRVLDELRDGDEVALFVTNGKPFPQQGKLEKSHDQVRQMLAQCTLSAERADVGARVEEARNVLVKAESANRQIIVISDLQANTWESFSKQAAEAAGPAGAATDEEQKRIDTPVVFVDLHQSPRPNVAVTRVEMEAAIPVAGLPIKAVAEVFNASSVPRQHVLELFVDGVKEASSPALQVPPESRLRHEFTFSFKGSGLHRGEVRLVGDEGSKLDDRRFFTIEVDQGIPVAVVKAQRHEIATLEDTFYLEQALGRGKAGGWAIRVAPLLVSQLPSEPLNNYKVIFCVNLPPLDDETAEKLRAYVERGGNVVWIAGENVAPEEYNAMNQRARNQLLPASLVETRMPAAGQERMAWTIATLDRQYRPLTRLIEPPSLYQTVQVFKHLRLDSAKGSGARVLARLDDGEPLLVQSKVGKGTTTLLGTDVHAWTTLPRKPIFVPLVAGLTFELAGSEQARREGVAGLPIILQFANEIPPSSVEVVPPSGETIRLGVETAEGDKAPTFRFTETYDTGFYQLRLLQAVSARQFGYAVNVDADEADPVKMKREDLEELFGKTPLFFAANIDELENVFRLLRQGRSLWSTFLIGVLCVLVFETFLSNRLSPTAESDQVPKPPPGMRRLAKKAQSAGAAGST